MATNGSLCRPGNIRVCLCLSSSTATTCWFMLCPGQYFSEMSMDLAIRHMLILVMAQSHCNKRLALSTRQFLCLLMLKYSLQLQKDGIDIIWKYILFLFYRTTDTTSCYAFSWAFSKTSRTLQSWYVHTRQLVLLILWIDGGPVW